MLVSRWAGMRLRTTQLSPPTHGPSLSSPTVVMQGLFSGGVDGSTIVWNVPKVRHGARRSSPAPPRTQPCRPCACPISLDLFRASRVARAASRPCPPAPSFGFLPTTQSKPQQTFRDHEHYVQGVAWDPQGIYLVSISCDRTARIYGGAVGKGGVREFKSQHVLSKGTQAALQTAEAAAQQATGTDTSPEKASSSSVGGVAASSTPSESGSSAAQTAQASAEVPLETVPQPTGALPEGVADSTSRAVPSNLPAGGAGAVTDEKAPPGPGKSESRRAESKDVKCRLFLDDSVGSFFRRPAWSPDGTFVLLPCGQVPTPPNPAAKSDSAATKPTTFVVSRWALSTPCAHLPGPSKPVIATRFCPVLFELVQGAGDDPVPAWTELPYRVVWAVVTLDAIVMYDSQHKQPLLMASNIHFAAISDIAWLPSGDGLVVSSMDGFCTLLLLQSDKTLGKPLPKELWPECMQPKVTPSPSEAAPVASSPASAGTTASATTSFATPAVPAQLAASISATAPSPAVEKASTPGAPLAAPSSDDAVAPAASAAMLDAPIADLAAGCATTMAADTQAGASAAPHGGGISMAKTVEPAVVAPVQVGSLRAPPSTEASSEGAAAAAGVAPASSLFSPPLVPAPAANLEPKTNSSEAKPSVAPNGLPGAEAAAPSAPSAIAPDPPGPQTDAPASEPPKKKAKRITPIFVSQL